MASPDLIAAQATALATQQQVIATWFAAGLAGLATLVNTAAIILIAVQQRRDMRDIEAARRREVEAQAARRLLTARLNAFDGMDALKRAIDHATIEWEYGSIEKGAVLGRVATAQRLFELVLTAEVADLELRSAVQRADAMAARIQGRVDNAPNVTLWHVIGEEKDEVAALTEAGETLGRTLGILT